MGKRKSSAYHPQLALPNKRPKPDTPTNQNKKEETKTNKDV